MLAVVVFAHNRPRYLYVTLSSIFAMDNIKQHNVFIFVDGGINAKIREMQAETISYFPIFAFFRQKRCKILHNIADGLHRTFTLGFDEIVYFEDDFVIRPDTLNFIKHTPREGIFLSLCALPEQPEFESSYRPMGNVIGRRNFAFLYDWIENRRYIGLKRPGKDEILTEQVYSHDAIFSSFLLYNGFSTKFARKPYVAHFGARGIHSKIPLDDSDLLALEERMFAGDKSTWLSNVVHLLENRDFPKKFERQFIPCRGFRYSRFE